MARLRLSALWFAFGLCAVAGAAEPVRMQMAGWQLAASKITGSYQPNHVVVLDVVLTQGADSIRADKAEASALDVKDATWYLSGNVHVQVPQGEVMSDTATVTFRDGKVVAATAHGDPANFVQHSLTGMPPASGHAKDFAWDVPKGDVHLNGDAFVTREHNDITACRITYNILQQTVDAEKCENAEEGIHGTVELKQSAPASGGAK